jgi:hypothetical protein
VLDTRLAIGGEAGTESAIVLAVPAVAQRNRKFGLRTLFAQTPHDRRGLLGRKARAVPPFGKSDARASAASELPPIQIGIGFTGDLTGDRKPWSRGITP